MDDRESRHDPIGTIRKAVEVAQPDLRAYYRMTRKGKIVAVYASDGAYYADVQPLRNDGQEDNGEPVIPRFPARCLGRKQPWDRLSAFCRNTV